MSDRTPNTGWPTIPAPSNPVAPSAPVTRPGQLPQPPKRSVNRLANYPPLLPGQTPG